MGCLNFPCSTRAVSANRKMKTKGPGDSSASGHVMSDFEEYKEEQEEDMNLDEQLNEVLPREEVYEE